MKIVQKIVAFDAKRRADIEAVLRADGGCTSNEQVAGVLAGELVYTNEPPYANTFGAKLRLAGAVYMEHPENAPPAMVEQARHRAAVWAAASRSIARFNTVLSDLLHFPWDQWETINDDARNQRLALKQAHTELKSALQTRGIDWSKLKDDYSATRTPKSWVSDAKYVAKETQMKRVPFFRAKREEDVKYFQLRGRPLASCYQKTLDAVDATAHGRRVGITQNAFNAWVDSAQKACKEGRVTLDSVAETVPESPQSLLPMWAGGDAPNGVEALTGAQVAPHVRVGEVALLSSSGQLTHDPVNGSGSQLESQLHFSHNPALFRFAVEIDLDLEGGFVTDSAAVVEAAVLQLLDTVPAGRLRIDAVDPMRLGESLGYLYGLNDSGDKILGDAIWTTASHTSRLLEQLETHVTFVTQKYLQGQHETLTSYNLDAGEVAEPYRIVLLYDFPQMFTRDGRTNDEEALTRLQKLITVGRRCGVYFFVTAPKRTAENPALSGLHQLYPSNSEGSPSMGDDVGGITRVGLGWALDLLPAPDATERERIISRVLRGLQHQTDKRVLPETVMALADRRSASLASKGLLKQRLVVADPSAPDTWWQGSSATSIESRFGQMGASGVAELRFDSAMKSSALVGGQTGSGKSYLFHSIIMDLVLNYSPAELELYLIDLKEGVEFSQYARQGLPHAKAIAIESNREFAVSVLRDLDAEITRRGTSFKGQSGTVVNLSALRAQTNEVLPRVLVVIDEFHKLFSEEDALRRQAEQLLERIIKEGRAFGVHVMLGSQSIALVGSAFRSIADQIYHRLVLASSDTDSRLLLGEGNPDAQLLTRPGEGILNTNGGLREANGRFQTTFWSAEDRTATLASLRQKADADGFVGSQPFVFEGAATVPVESIPSHHFGQSNPNKSIQLLLGAPMSLDGPFSATLERAPGRNVLIVDDSSAQVAVMMAVDLAGAEVETTFFDFGGLDGVGSAPISDALGQAVSMVHPRQLLTVMQELVKEIDARIDRNSFSDPARVIILAGLQRARGLSNDYTVEEDSPSALLTRILTDGPEVGIFTIATADRPASVDRRFSSQMLREFGVKVIGRMSQDDSRRLVDTDVGVRLKESELFFDDEDRVITQTLRRLHISSPDWVHRIRAFSDVLS